MALTRPTPVEATPNKCLIAKVRFCFSLPSRAIWITKPDLSSSSEPFVALFRGFVKARHHQRPICTRHNRITREIRIVFGRRRWSLMIRGCCVMIGTTSAWKRSSWSPRPCNVVDRIKIKLAKQFFMPKQTFCGRSPWLSRKKRLHAGNNYLNARTRLRNSYSLFRLVCRHKHTKSRPQTLLESN